MNILLIDASSMLGMYNVRMYNLFKQMEVSSAQTEQNASRGVFERSESKSSPHINIHYACFYL